MKSIFMVTALLIGLSGLAAASLAQAETVVSVTQVSYNYLNKPVCSAVRMNPATFGALPSDPCTLATTGSFGSDRISKSLYDVAGQLIEIDQALGTADFRPYARYTYSNNGLKKSELDANYNLTYFDYDGFDRPQKIIYSVTATAATSFNNNDYEWFTYDTNGNRASWRRRDGQMIYYSYDNLNRETLKDVPGGTASDVYTGYDGLGHIAYRRFASSSGSGVNYSYDGLGRITNVTDYNGRTVGHAYNEASVPIVVYYPDGNLIGITRDVASRMTAIGYNGWSGLFSQNYDNLGHLYSQGKAGGTSTFVTDSVGRLSSLTNDLNGTAYDVAWSFNYNPSGQITSTSATSTTYDYKETSSTTVNQTYDGLNRDAAIAAVGGGYDTRGNLTYDGARTFTYDIENRLLTAVSASANVKLVYDPEGRLSKYSTDGGASYSTFLYDGVNLIGEYDAGGVMTERYVHGGGTDNPVVWLHGPGATDIRWFYTDYHGSIIGYTDNTGNIVNYYKYGPYGEPKNASNITSFTGPRFRYTGQTVIPEVGLYYFKARVYDPIFGRFLQTDPIGSDDDLDLYVYTAGDPINKSDPTGKTVTCATDNEGNVVCRVNCHSLLECFGDAMELKGIQDRMQKAAEDAARGRGRSYNDDAQSDDDTKPKPPPGSKPISDTPWSGDHGDIKSGIGAGPTDDVRISPDGHVWGQNPDGTWTDHGEAGDYTNSGNASGQRGKDRDRKRDERRDKARGR